MTYFEVLVFCCGFLAMAVGHMRTYLYVCVCCSVHTHAVCAHALVIALECQLLRQSHTPRPHPVQLQVQ
jgi:hypothetical protein